MTNRKIFLLKRYECRVLCQVISEVITYNLSVGCVNFVVNSTSQMHHDLVQYGGNQNGVVLAEANARLEGTWGIQM
jgi:hypothetical protein